jgi:pimeloyl-ACP methyl ester carboxylesterase
MRAAWLSVALLACVLAAPCRGAAQPEDEVFPVDELPGGKTIAREECARLAHAVWVEHRYGAECIRYFPSPGIERAPQASFFFHGDLLDGNFPIRAAYTDNRSKVLLAWAKRMEATWGFAFVYVARPGTYGSSGRHAERRRPKEFYSMNAAIDAIKAKHGVGKVLLSGQSGGATIVGALLTLGRADVVCAVGTSGGYAVIERVDFIRRAAGARTGFGRDSTGYTDVYDVVEYVAGIQPDPQRRIFLIGDPLDQMTPFVLQKKFADRIRAAGHEVRLVEARATGSLHHSLRPVGLTAVGLCGQGATTEEIIRRIGASGPPE